MVLIDFCGLCIFCHGLFALSLDVIGRFVATPDLLYYFVIPLRSSDNSECILLNNRYNCITFSNFDNIYTHARQV